MLGFDLAWFGSLSSEFLCIFGLHDAVFIYFFIFVTLFSYLLVN